MTIKKQFNEFRKEFMGKYYKPIKVMPEDYICIIEDMKIIGLAVINIVNSLTRKALVIEDFIIDKEYRNQGHGTELMEKIIGVAKRKKVNCIEVATKKTNKQAIAFYKKFKFKDRNNIAYRLWLK
jgi:ribosomal protein S18 acetylase RimI-like enzyme